MEVKNMVTPNQTQMNEFLEGDIDSPISMVNLLKFKAQGHYEDGRLSNLMGEEVVMLQMMMAEESKMVAECCSGGLQGQSSIETWSDQVVALIG